MNCKHFAAVLEAIPHHLSGGGITPYAVLCALRERGHKVTIITLQGHTLTRDAQDALNQFENLQQLGMSVRTLDTPAPATGQSRGQWLLGRNLPAMFVGYRYRGLVEQQLRELQPDGVFAYHWEALASLYGINQIPKLGTVGDPIHLPRLFRAELERRYQSWFHRLKAVKHRSLDMVVIPKLVRAMNLLLGDCDERGAFAAHHAAMFRDSGVQECRYFRTPVPDPRKEFSQLVTKPDRLKILLIGHLKGIATLSGIELFAEETLPALEQLLPSGSFEVHVVGGFYESMPERLRALLNRPYVRIRGQMPKPHEEFLSSHVMLVPTPIELGIRVRVISAFSYGACVVAHAANQAGIPEMRHRENCLMGSTGLQIAELCVEAYRNENLRRQIERGARETYEEYFSIEKAGGAIADLLEGMTHGAGAGKSVTSAAAAF